MTGNTKERKGFGSSRGVVFYKLAPAHFLHHHPAEDSRPACRPSSGLRFNRGPLCFGSAFLRLQRALVHGYGAEWPAVLTYGIPQVTFNQKPYPDR